MARYVRHAGGRSVSSRSRIASVSAHRSPMISAFRACNRRRRWPTRPSISVPAPSRVSRDGPVRALIHRLKYGDRMEFAKPLGLWMARAGAELLAEADLLIPVPLHRRRLIWRQFNQANALAEVVGRASGKKVDPFALVRVKQTVPQVGLTRSQRADNVQGAFKVPEGGSLAIMGRKVLLIDDVLTSGATLNAAARALLRGGAARVDVLVFARVVSAD